MYASSLDSRMRGANESPSPATITVCRRGGLLVLQAERADGNAHDVQHALESLRQHLLNLAASETGGREVQAGKRQHVALDAPAFFLIDRHHHQHAGEKLRQEHQGQQAVALHERQESPKRCRKVEQAPTGEGDSQKHVRARFLPAAFLQESVSDQQEDESDGQHCWRDVQDPVHVNRRPRGENHGRDRKRSATGTLRPAYDRAAA